MFCMACSDVLDFPLGAGAEGFDFCAGVGNMYTWSSEEANWQWVFGVLGSGNGVQTYGAWLNDVLLGPFMFTALLSQQSSDFFFFCPRPKN